LVTLRFVYPHWAKLQEGKLKLDQFAKSQIAFGQLPVIILGDSKNKLEEV